MEACVRRILSLAAIGLLVAVYLTPCVEAAEITDMFGRHFHLPECSLKVYSASPPDTFLLYAIDPTLLAGLNFPIKEQDTRFMHPHTLKLPLIGGTFGEASTPNLEMLLRVNPDLVVVSNNETSLSLTVNETLKKMNKPLIEMTLVGLADYPAAFLRMGKLLARQPRAIKLSDYTRKTLIEAARTVAALPPGKKVTVYYAEGVDGLRTECDTSRHNELISLAGGMNVHHCKARNLFGMEKVSMEQVLVYDPEVLLVMDKGFYRRVFNDPKWKRIRAVRKRRVYLIPNQPSNWFDRPPTFMRFIGLKWVMKCLYPKEYRIDIIRESQDFYQLFLSVEVSESEMKKIIYQ